jgi:2,5-diketo-D-gluconate reductase A
MDPGDKFGSGPPGPTLRLKDGHRMPLLGLGTWELRDDGAQQAVEWALDAGYRHIDTATGYQNEEFVGRALRRSGVPRDEVFITTKLPPDHVGRERRTIEESLCALGLDHVDLWLIHWPPQGGPGLASWRAFLRVLEEGLATAIGVSNYSIEQIDVLTTETGVAPAVNQIEWSPFRHDPTAEAAHNDRGIVLVGYSPFKASQLDDSRLVQIARDHVKTPQQVVIRWHLQHGIPVLPRSSRRERIEANAQVLDFELSDAEMRAMDGFGYTSRSSSGGHR